MNFQICTFNKFYAICILKSSRIGRHKNFTYHTNRWRFKTTLIGQGSLTRYSQYKSGMKTLLTKLQIANNSKTLESRKFRCVWIEQEFALKLTLARSLWQTIYNKTSHFGQFSKSLIGIHTINNKSDTEKITHEIYYGYCKEIELFSKQSKIITGKKSTLYYKNKYHITMQEFFPIINKII